MGAHSVVVIHHYQDKRGTASGLVLTKEGELRLSMQSITFRIPKFLLWMSLRRRPRTMALITYGQLGERQSPLVQYFQLTDKALKQRLEQEWQALNDYVGMACYQLENDQPLWRTLMDSLSADALAQWVASSRFDDKRLQQDRDFTGFWAGNVFISRRQGAAPALQLLWRDAQNQIQPGYIYSLAASTAQAEANAQAQSRPALLIRPQRGETSFMLNAFDTRHLQLAHDLLTYAAGAQPSRTADSGKLGVIIDANGNKISRRLVTASSSNSASPLFATMAVSSTSQGMGYFCSLAATALSVPITRFIFAASPGRVPDSDAPGQHDTLIYHFIFQVYPTGVISSNLLMMSKRWENKVHKWCGN